MLSKLRLSTPKEGFIKITRDVESLVAESGVKEGICVVFCPHTTAGITINENADPDVVRDLTYAMNITSPDRPEYRHAEGAYDRFERHRYHQRRKAPAGKMAGHIFCRVRRSPQQRGHCEDNGGLSLRLSSALQAFL